MKPVGLRIGFMGTPEFAAVHLSKLLDAACKVIVVVTQPDRRKGRGGKVQESPVKQLALERGLKVLQPGRVGDPEVVSQLTSFAPDVMVVVAYGQLLPRSVLDVPRLGTINVHGSLLPAYRGAAPVNWALIHGENVTGVTTMMLDEGLDTGDILLQAEMSIEPEDTAGTLVDRLAHVGADLLLDTLSKLEDNTLPRVPQDHSKATYAPKLTKGDGLIKWNGSAVSIVNGVRGLDPWPGAYTFLGDKRLRLFGASQGTGSRTGPPGTVLGLTESSLEVAAGEGSVEVREMQMEGRKRLPAVEFLKGVPLPPGAVLGER
ncbi:MAG: methionyl-tRNA formyltransferase [Deltaproteobacteria bacterium]|nr:methionyl-tRNA formyltransferase [Deltaproteobacteria bacterium]